MFDVFHYFMVAALNVSTTMSTSEAFIKYIFKN